MAEKTDLIALWRTIQEAGGIEAYIESQLRKKGLYVRRQDTDNMSASELENYKTALRLESAERKKIASECWRAYKANHVVFLGENVFWSDEPFNGPYETINPEERAAENGLPTLDNPNQLAEFLGLSISELRGFAFHTDLAKFVHYARFTIPKRDGTERPIWAPMPRLKEVQRKILTEIVERLPVHGAAHGFITGRSIVTNAQVHRNSRLILKMDIKDFFPTVTWRRVKGVFNRAGYREQVATLLALLVTESPREIIEHNGQKYYVALGPRCLPQGAPTSPSITNALCLRMDHRLSGLAQKAGYRYTRYADDLTFSLPLENKGKPHLGRLIGLVKSIVAEEGFQIHPEKTRVHRIGGSQRVTGLVVNGDKGPRVGRELKRRLRAALHNRQNNKPRPENAETDAQLRGYGAYIFMTEPELGAKILQQLAESDKKE
ncbi:MAG: reverse transcriptase family protein [Gemmataceae bacterium]|nr:reverse transcriptase family protein [Gemmataceae bacterium]